MVFSVQCRKHGEEDGVPPRHVRDGQREHPGGVQLLQGYGLTKQLQVRLLCSRSKAAMLVLPSAAVVQ